MQVGLGDIRKVRNENLLSKFKINTISVTAICALLASRVQLVENIAPFGIMFLICLLASYKRKDILIVALFSAIGYLTTLDGSLFALGYCIVILYIVLISLLRIVTNRKYILFANLAGYFCIMTAFRCLIFKMGVLSSLGTEALEMLCVIPIYFILKYAFIVMNEFRTNHMYNSEEVAALSTMAAIVIGGFSGFEFYSVNLASILALLVTVVVSIVCGNGMGIVTATIISSIIGINNGEVLAFIGVFTGLAVVLEITRESGKYISIIAGAITMAILMMFQGEGGSIGWINAGVGLLLGVLIPNKFYNGLSQEFNFEVKRENIYSMYENKVKTTLSDKMSCYSNVLLNISEIMRDLSMTAKNDCKECDKGFLSSVYEEACGSCSMRGVCWEKEREDTFNSFIGLIENLKLGNVILPDELEKKCISRTRVVRASTKIANDLLLQDIYSEKLIEGRKLLSESIANMAISMEEVAADFNQEISFDIDEEKRIAYALGKKNIKFRNLSCNKNKYGRTIVKVQLKHCGGSDMCVSGVLPILCNVLGKEMCVGNERCITNKDFMMCYASFEERPKFYISSASKVIPKDGEIESGDTNFYAKNKNGEYNIFLSDGMGSGRVAGYDSKMVIELLGKFTEAGLTKETTVDILNSIMSIKFSEEEKFATLDMTNIDLYTGDLQVLKVGGASTFIKKENDVEVVNGNSLPIGVLDKPDVQSYRTNVRNGDFVVMVTDGVVDCEKGNEGNTAWIYNLIKESNKTSAEDLKNEIVNKALNLGKNKVGDDMTVVVSRVFQVLD